MTLRARLALAVAVVVAVLVLSGLALAALIHNSDVNEIDHQLVATSTAVDAFAQKIKNIKVTPPPSAPEVPYTELYIGGLDEDGRLVTFLRPALNANAVPRVTPAQAAAHVAERGSTPHPFEAPSSDPDGSFRVVATHRPGGGYILTALPTDRMNAAYRRIVTGIIAAGSVLLATLALATWWVERHGLRPIASVTEAAEAIAAGELDRRVNPPPGRTEAAQLAHAFNVMVDERQSSEERLRRFVADASHELRTPLTTIVGVMELHRSGSLPPGAGLNDALRRADLEARRMSTLVEDLLLLARLDQGRPLADEAVDLGRLARDAVFDARLAQPIRRLRADIAPAPLVRGDESRLRQVVTNLVTNALTHTSAEAQIRVAVRAFGSGHDRVCVLEVSDNGPGMSPEQARHVFERFYRVDAGRARRHGGSGLGLSIVRSIVEAHGGKVTLHTAPGRGATFRVILPTEPSYLQETSRSSRPPVETDGSVSRHGVLAPDNASTTGATRRGVPT